MSKKKIIEALLALLVLLVGIIIVFGGRANATEETHAGPQGCFHREVAKEAWDEVVPAVPGPWWNWSPNKDQEPFEGPPAFPSDERGTWEGPHTEGGPGADQVGTFQQGEGHGSWFHRDPGTEEEVIHHPTEYKWVEHECKIPPKPKPVIQKGVYEEDPDCKAGTVAVVTEIDTADWIWSKLHQKWYPLAPTYKKIVKYRDATDQECPPAVVDKPVVETTPVNTDRVLPDTGAPSMGWGMLIGGLSFVFGTGILLAVYRKRIE